MSSLLLCLRDPGARRGAVRPMGLLVCAALPAVPLSRPPRRPSYEYELILVPATRTAQQRRDNTPLPPCTRTVRTTVNCDRRPSIAAHHSIRLSQAAPLRRPFHSIRVCTPHSSVRSCCSPAHHAARGAAMQQRQQPQHSNAIAAAALPAARSDRRPSVCSTRMRDCKHESSDTRTKGFEWSSGQAGIDTSRAATSGRGVVSIATAAAVRLRVPVAGHSGAATTGGPVTDGWSRHLSQVSFRRPAA